MSNSDIDGTVPPSSSTSSGAHLSIECGTCVATGTTACTDCIVTHLLANDDGPIDLVTVPVPAPTAPTAALERALMLFRLAGLVNDPIEFVSLAEFERGGDRPADLSADLAVPAR